MRILEMVGNMLRPIRSDENKLLNAAPQLSSAAPSIKVSSPVFADHGNIPKEYSADGAGKFPTIAFDKVPESSASLLLVVEDPDAPKPTPFIHGIFYNIPPVLKELSQDMVTAKGLTPELHQVGIRLGKNSMGQASYMAPTPPPGHGPHHYHFQVLALDTMLKVSEHSTLSELKEAMSGHVIAFGELVGIYER